MSAAASDSLVEELQKKAPNVILAVLARVDGAIEAYNRRTQVMEAALEHQSRQLRDLRHYGDIGLEMLSKMMPRADQERDE